MKAGPLAALVILAAAMMAGNGDAARSEPAVTPLGAEAKPYHVPVVMEKATVRGKVVILETERDERRASRNLRVQIWSRKNDPTTGKAVPDQLVHKTRTDMDGFFSLPVIEEGEYMLLVGDLKLRLAVLPTSPSREGQQEPKVLLLLLPKEVV